MCSTKCPSGFYFFIKMVKFIVCKTSVIYQVYTISDTGTCGYTIQTRLLDKLCLINTAFTVY